MRSGSLIMVVIVVPAFTVRNQGDEEVVAAVVGCVVVAIAERMAERVDGPCAVQNEYGSNDDAPEEHAQAELHWAGALDKMPGYIAASKNDDGVNDVNL